MSKFANKYTDNLKYKSVACLPFRNLLRTHRFCISLTKPVVTHRYTVSLETENNLTDPHKTTIQRVKFLRKYKDKQLLGGKNTF